MIEILFFGFLWYQVVAIFGVSAGLHRYFAHKQFIASKTYEIIALYLAMLAGSRSPLGWIGAHRIHHQYSDTDKDPHSPTHQGFWKVLLNMWTIKNIPKKYIKDLIKNPRVIFFHRYWLHMHVLTLVITFMIGFKFFVIFVLIPYILGFLGYGLFNVLGHSDDKPTNNWIINILAVGEGFHEPHHKNSRLIRLHKWDITGWIIEKLFLTNRQRSEQKS